MKNGQYQVAIRDAAKNAIARLPKARQKQIQLRIDALTTEPRPHGCVKLAGYDALWRIRVGDYRIIYEIQDDRRIVIILIIAHRRESYRGL